jgi:hypothetical protein
MAEDGPDPEHVEFHCGRIVTMDELLEVVRTHWRRPDDHAPQTPT